MWFRKRDTKSSQARHDAVEAVDDHVDVNGTAALRPEDPPEDSDVFLSGRSILPRDAEAPAAEPVTLFVYGWSSVQPGVLSWTFPSLGAAVSAARKMRNAQKWAIVRGGGYASVTDARLRGDVLVEQVA